MILLRILLLLVVALSAEAAAPVISCTPTRTSGTEPFSVVFDCTGTTDADTSKPFHDLLYRTNFGDTNVGTETWANGANTNASKNFATGPIVAHVFESCVGSPFTVTHYVTDGTNVSQTTNTITVACADDTYTGTATVCFFNSTVGSGCPSGAAESASSDWDSALSLCVGLNKRCLFKRGDTFAASTSGNISASGVTIGAYGSGAKPIVTSCTGCDHLAATSARDNITIMDLDLRGTGIANSSENAIDSNAASSNWTILRVTASEIGSAVLRFAVTASGIVVQDSSLSTFYNSWGSFLQLSNSALLGSTFGPIGGGTAEGIIRFMIAQKVFIAHNTITGGAALKATMSIRSLVHSTSADDSFYVLVSDNKITTSGQNGLALGFEKSSGGDERVYDVIAERNWILAGAGTTGVAGLKSTSVRGTFRNNLIDLTAITVSAARWGVQIRRDDAAAPAPDDNNIYNNTVYSHPGISSANTLGVILETSAVTNTIVKNNLCYFPDGGSGNTCLSNSGTGTVAATNTGNIGTITTDPSFDGPTSTPSGFRIGTSSYAATGGSTLYPAGSDDFLSCDDNTSNERLGAFVPQARARCTSAAGP